MKHFSNDLTLSSVVWHYVNVILLNVAYRFGNEISLNAVYHYGNDLIAVNHVAIHYEIDLSVVTDYGFLIYVNPLVKDFDFLE